MERHSRQRGIAAASIVAIGALIAGCVCLGVAAALYPGGTAFDASTRGFALWRNYWSDLMHPVALGGQPNPLGSRAAQVGALAFAASLLAFWWAAPEAFRDRRWLRKATRIMGTLSAASLIGVPPGLLDVPHYVAIFLALVLGAGASIATLVGLARAPGVPPWIVALGLAALGSSVLGFALYARDLIVRGTPLLATPAVQKVATLCLVAWVLAGAGYQLWQSRAGLHPER